MATFTTNLVIELIGTGELAGTWGTTTNQNFQYVFEEAIVGRAGVAFSDANVTLTTTQATTDQTFRNVYLNCTGTNTAQRSLIVPTINKNYIVENNTTGGFAILVTTSGGTGLVVPNGYKAALYVDGTNVVTAFNYLSSLTVAGSLTTGSYVANGSITSSAYIGAYSYGTLTYLDANNFATYQTSANSYAQVVLQNTSTGPAASADVIVSNNLGTASNYYGDFGINGSGFSGSGNFQAPNNVYLYSIGSDLAIGTQSSNAIHFIVGGATAADALILDSNQNLGLGVTPPSNSQSNGGLYIGSYASHAVNTSTNATIVGQNVYYLSTTPVYRNTGYAALYQQTTSGVHSWLVAPSGTANSSSVTSGLAYIVASLGTTTLAQWQAYFSGLSTIPTVGQAITATATGSIAGGATVTAQVVFNQAMTLTNAGYLGIGTSSPSQLLDIASTTNAAAVIESSNSANFSYLSLKNTGGTAHEWQLATGGSTSSAANTFYIYDATAAAVRMTLDTSGNLGLGVTPSAIYSAYKGIQLYDATSMGMYGSGYGASVTSNAYPSATGSVYTRGGNSYRPTKYSAFDGTHTWSYSAAAGTTISWTDAMTLNNSGYLGIGITPTHSLHVQGTGTSAVAAIQNSSSNGYASTLYQNDASAFVSMGIGGSASGLFAGQAYIDSSSGVPIVFAINDVTKMTLNNSGQLLVGATSFTGTARVMIMADGTYATLECQAPGTGSYGQIQFVNGNGSVGSIVTNGTSTAYNTSSDRRLKTNIVDLTNSGTIIDSLKPRAFTWISDNSADAGFIADEFQQVLPKAVTGQPNATKEEEYEVTPAVKDSMGNITTPAVMGTRTVPVYQMIDASQPELIAYLVAEVQSLRARLKAANIA